MATMIPETISPDAPPSERRVFGLLRDDPATDGWVAIHSSRHGAPGHGALGRGVDAGRPREIDFLVLIPNYGILCVEAKGGGFRVAGGQWSALASGNAIEPPVRQAENAMYALKAELARQFGASSDLAQLPTDCAVVFTDANWPDGVRRPPRLVIDHADLRSGLSLGRRLQAVALRMRPAVGRRAAARPAFTAAAADRLRRYLAPDFTLELVAAIGPQLDIIDEQLIRLTEEQYAALDLARDNDRCLFKGAAGTGKTMLALECARRAAAAGYRVGLLCYNRLLGHWLAQQAGDAAGLAAGAFWPRLHPLIVNGPVGRDFAAACDRAAGEPELYEQVYPEYARRALQHTGPQFDVLVMDEAQDLCQSPYLEISDLALAGGLRRGRWAMFGDFTNQAIYLSRAADPERNLLQYCEHPARRNLYVNCRNTPPIARDTARVAGSAIPETRLREMPGPRPQYQYWQDAAELSDLLDEEVHRLLAEDVHIDEIVVLSAGRLDNTGLDRNRTYGSYPLADYSRGQRIAAAPDTAPDAYNADADADAGNAADAGAHLKFCTVQSFKGMESNVVILILERLDRLSDAPNAYIGMSRARGALTVLAQAGLKPEVAARLAV